MPGSIIELLSQLGKKRTYLSPEEEAIFKPWYQKMANTYKLDPNPDDPRHFYDYRGAWKGGAIPTWQPEHQQYRWPDKFKLQGYPYK